MESILTLESSRTRFVGVLFSPNFLRNIVLNVLQLVMEDSSKDKNHVESLFSNVRGENRQKTSSCQMLWSQKESNYLLTSSSTKSFPSRSNFGKHFYRCLVMSWKCQVWWLHQEPTKDDREGDFDFHYSDHIWMLI